MRVAASALLDVHPVRQGFRQPQVLHQAGHQSQTRRASHRLRLRYIVRLEVSLIATSPARGTLSVRERMDRRNDAAARAREICDKFNGNPGEWDPESRRGLTLTRCATDSYARNKLLSPPTDVTKSEADLEILRSLSRPVDLDGDFHHSIAASSGEAYSVLLSTSRLLSRRNASEAIQFVTTLWNAVSFMNRTKISSF